MGRRRLAQLMSLGAVSAVSTATLRPSIAANPPGLTEPGSFRISGEFEPTRAIWLGYDQGHKALTVALVKALMSHVDIKLMTSDAASELAARELLTSNNISLRNIQFFIAPRSLFFMRDIAVFSISPNGNLTTVSFRWQHYGVAGWCKRLYGKKAEQVNDCIGEPTNSHNDFGSALARSAGTPNLLWNLTIEGGAIEANGKGLVLANEALLLQRNPGANRATLEQRYRDLPGIRKVR